MEVGRHRCNTIALAVRAMDSQNGNLTRDATRGTVKVHNRGVNSILLQNSSENSDVSVRGRRYMTR